MKLKTTYATLIASGTNASYDHGLNKRIKILNTFAVIWVHLVVFFLLANFTEAFIIGYSKGFYSPIEYIELKPFFGQLTTGLLMCLIIYINSKHQFKIARTLFFIITFLNFGLFTLIIEPGKYIEYYFVFVSGIGLALFVKNTVPFIMMLFSFFIFLTPYFFYVVYPQDYIDRLLIPAVFCVFLSTYLLINYFKKLNNSNENLLEIEKNKVLAEKINLEKKEAELKELNEFKSHFYVNLSHEIRTPLTLINGYVQQILAEKTSKNIAEKINVIQSQTNQMQSIINSIMDLSKMESNNFEFDCKKTDIIQLVTKVYNEFVSLFEQKQINIVFESQFSSCFIALDPDFISKSISNLLSNSLKFTAINGKVKISIIEEEQEIKIIISDDGIGIPQDDINTIFTPFFQSKNHITKSQGSGIGLAFTKKILELHQYKIKVESISNIGTHFIISIPKTAIIRKTKKFISTKFVADTNNLANKIDNDLFVPSTKSKINVLIVEDHLEMQNYLKSILEKYSITQALNGKEALDLLEKNSFDLIITDFMMPVMDGEALVTEIKNQNIKTPIIVLTARTDNKGKLNMLRLGVDGYMHKPFLEEELLLQIRNSLKLYNNINQFENSLDTSEKEYLNFQAQKFNQELLDFINPNLNSNILSVELIANHFEISKSTLNRKIKSILGQTTQEFILEARLQTAREILEENPFESKKNIAQKVGLSNTSYLFEKLHSRFGKTYD